MDDTQKEAKSKVWKLSEDLAYNSGIVYVHSSTRNFNKALKQNGLAQLILQTVKPLGEALETNLSYIKQQINPSNLPKPDHGTRYDILKMFNKDSNSFVAEMDELKSNIKRILQDPAYIRYNEYLESSKTKTQQVNDVDIVMMSRINEGSIGYKTIKKPEDIKKCAIDSSNAIIKLLNITDTNTVKSIQDEFIDIYNMYGKRGVGGKRSAMQGRIASHATHQVTGMDGASFLSKINALFKNLQSTVLQSDYKKSYEFFAGLKDMNDLLLKSKQVYTNLGDLYEDATRVLLANNHAALQLYGTAPVIKGVGTSGANKWNSTDIEMSLRDVNGFTAQVGASLKQQQDFTKAVPLTVDELLKLDIGAKIPLQAINQYKYFVLNYSILTDHEGHSGRGDKDGWLGSLTEFLGVKQALDNFFGKIIFTRALLGPILFNTQNTLQDRRFTKKPSSGSALAPPYILVTQSYACFTYDLLDAIQLLMDDNVVTMQLSSIKYSKTSMHDFESLHASKKGFIQKHRTKGTLNDQDYSTMLSDTEFGISSKISALNKSAFGETGASLGIDTVINTSKLMEALQSKIHLR